MMITERLLLAKMSGKKNIYECSGSPVFFVTLKNLSLHVIFTSETNMRTLPVSTLTVGSLHKFFIKCTEHNILII